MLGREVGLNPRKVHGGARPPANSARLNRPPGGATRAAMTASTLAAGALLDALSLALYLWVGRLVLQEYPDAPGRTREAFATFWYGVGIVNGLQAGLEVVAVFRDPGVPLAFAVWNTRIAVALASFAGLVYYLLFVYTGRRRLFWSTLLFYVATFMLMQVWLMQSGPAGTDVSHWRVDLRFEHADKGALYKLVVLMFFVPPLLASAAYAMVLRMAKTPMQRHRVRLMSGSLGVYFLGLTMGYLNTGWPWWGLVENLLGIGAALVAILALRPPRAVRARLEAPGEDT